MRTLFSALSLNALFSRVFFACLFLLSYQIWLISSQASHLRSGSQRIGDCPLFRRSPSPRLPAAGEEPRRWRPTKGAMGKILLHACFQGLYESMNQGTHFPDEPQFYIIKPNQAHCVRNIYPDGVPSKKCVFVREQFVWRLAIVLPKYAITGTLSQSSATT